MFAPASKGGILNPSRTPDVVPTQNAVGPDIFAVCSTPSRRVAALRPRYAGLTALTASPRTVTITALNRRLIHATPKMLWSTNCPEFRDLKRPLTAGQDTSIF